MAYKLIVKPEADNEMFEAIDWYMDKDIDLGLRFAKELKDTLYFIELHPEHFQKKYENIRICFTRTFPYGIHYIVEKTNICIGNSTYQSKTKRLKKWKSYFKLAKLAFKVSIFASASASFCLSKATTCSGAPLT
ncbi:MAG TPA: hypothetical protein DCX41_12740, partial [Aequorivita sp.]|nr:hypothetical protein [Aequorivita sp.]